MEPIKINPPPDSENRAAHDPLKIQTFAPVLIPTLNRYDYFKKCVTSLSSCLYADKTDLFISLDYPFKDDHWDGYNKIVEFIKNIKGFRAVNIIRRTENYGAKKNTREALSKIFQLYDRMILSEDDNIFSEDFLRFVNIGLEKYKHRDDIFAINGYNYPVKIPEDYKHDVYLWQGFSGWGAGIWKAKWGKLEWSNEIALKKIKDFLKSYSNVIEYNKIANHYVRGLLWMVRRQQIYGDKYINLYQFMNKMYSIFPTISRVRNLGHDGSGVHCRIKSNDPFKNQLIYENDSSYTLPLDIEPNNKINQMLYKHFKKSFVSQIVIAFLLLINSVTKKK